MQDTACIYILCCGPTWRCYMYHWLCSAMSVSLERRRPLAWMEYVLWTRDRRQPMIEISRIGAEFYGVPQCVVFIHVEKQLATIKNWRDHPSPIRPFTSWICLNELKDGRKDTSFTSFKKGWIGIHASLWREAGCWRHSRHLARGCEVFFTIYLIMKFQINAWWERLQDQSICRPQRSKEK